MGKPYKDEDYQYKPVNYYDSTDVGADELFMSPEDLAASKATKAEYEAAKAKGDQAGMDAAHAKQEERRAKYGYQGGANGGAYNPLAGATPGQGTAGKADTFTIESAPEYISKNQQIIDAALEQLRSRPAFSYDPETDPAYQQYKDQYTRQGKLAMEDTLGQVSARTGGLASSYAGSAAQQSYNQYMSALADKIPELQRLAYEKYRAEGDDMRADLNMILNKEQMERSAFESDRGQFNTEQSFKYGLWSDQQDREYRADETAYQRGRDALSDQRYEEEQDYARAQDQYNKDLAAGEYMAGAGQFGKLSQTLGLSEEETKALVNKYAEEHALTQKEAAIQIAQAKGAIGDLSGYQGLGWDTSYAKQLQDYELKKAAAEMVKKQSGGSGGGEEDTESAAYKDVTKKALAYDTPEEAKSYLERMVDSGAISPKEAAYIYQVLLGGEIGEESEEPEEPPLSMIREATGSDNPVMDIFKKKF